MREMVDIVIYQLAARIAPQNIAQDWINRYEDALKWLHKASRGEITTSLPLIQPEQGSRIRLGSNVKKENQW